MNMDRRAATLWSALVLLGAMIVGADTPPSSRAPDSSDDVILRTALRPWKNVSIELDTPDDRPPAFVIRGLTPHHLARLRELVEAGTAWTDLLSVRIEIGGRSLPPMLGSHLIDDDVVRFAPRFPLEPGRTYLVSLAVGRLSAEPSSSVLAKKFRLPEPHRGEPTRVAHVYPTADVVPENLLKFYLHFSAPMSQGDAYRHIHLLDAEGEAIDLPFLELGEELWNESGTRLTVFFDPGRIKRGVKPREDIGPVLEEGGSYTLVIDAAWPDAAGRPMAESYRRTFKVGPPDNEQPDPKQWIVLPPRSESRSPLVVEFGEPLDHALLKRVVRVERADGDWIDGEIRLEANESRWRFVPKRPWSAGSYRLTAETILEDLAGNSIGRPFEVDIVRPVERRVLATTAVVLFEVTAKSSNSTQNIKPKSDLVQQAHATADRAVRFLRSISAEGGYLWRYSADLKSRAGERPATKTQIWVQPPGTPSVGQALLELSKATNDTAHLDAAIAAGLALAAGQLESGGWDYVIDFDREQAKRWHRRSDIGQLSEREADRRRNVSTYDDDTTQSATRFLILLADALGDDRRAARIAAARDYALQKMLEAQYPNGAWPQRYDGKPKSEKDYPVLKASLPDDWSREWTREGYSNHYTLNDNTIRDCIRTMLLAYERLGDDRYLAAAKRGGDFLILAQLPEPQPAWAQQYDAQMRPAWARAFEPPAVTAGETAGVIRILVDLYESTGDRKYLEPIPRAIAWLQRSTIGEDRWARYYELGTNQPIYGDRDGKVHYTLEELSEERRKGYGWQGGFGIASAIRNYEEAARTDRPQPPQREARSVSRATRDKRARELEPRVRRIVESLDDEGRWLTTGSIDDGPRTEILEMRTYVQNLRLLAEYIALRRDD